MCCSNFVKTSMLSVHITQISWTDVFSFSSFILILVLINYKNRNCTSAKLRSRCKIFEKIFAVSHGRRVDIYRLKIVNFLFF
jgi:hypothetical protein